MARLVVPVDDTLGAAVRQNAAVAQLEGESPEAEDVDPHAALVRVAQGLRQSGELVRVGRDVDVPIRSFDGGDGSRSDGFPLPEALEHVQITARPGISQLAEPRLGISQPPPEARVELVQQLLRRDGDKPGGLVADSHHGTLLLEAAQCLVDLWLWNLSRVGQGVAGHRRLSNQTDVCARFILRETERDQPVDDVWAVGHGYSPSSLVNTLTPPRHQPSAPRGPSWTPSRSARVAIPGGSPGARATCTTQCLRHAGRSRAPRGWGVRGSREFVRMHTSARPARGQAPARRRRSQWQGEPAGDSRSPRR